MKRYYKGTDGVITVFRASGTKVYQSAWFTRHEGETSPTGSQGFSGKPAGNYRPDTYSQTAKSVPVVEITAAEFKLLVAIKNKRFDDPTRASPQDSWVRNTDIT